MISGTIFYTGQKRGYPLFQIFIFLISVGQIYAQEVSIRVFPEIRQQTIRSIGGNYCQANYTNHAWDAIGEATLKEFRPSHVRVALPMKLKDKQFIEYQKNNYLKQPLVIEVLETLKRMKGEFGVTNFTISVWDLPDEWIQDPSKKAQRVVKPDAYPEVIEALVSFFLEAKNDYGVEVDYFSFNESDGGYQVKFTPSETIAFITLAGKRFRESGLKTKFLWADTAQTKGTVEFATLIKADTTIWKYLGPLCFHSWWSEKIPDSEFERIAGLAKAWSKEVWCSELGFDAMAWKVKDMNKSWDYALRFAKISHRMLKYARVEVSLYWTWQNNYTIMSADLNEKYPSYYVTRHQVDYLNRGTQVVQSVSSDADVLALAAIRPGGGTILQAINLKKNPVKAIISGIGTGMVEIVSTTEKNLWNTSLKPDKTRNGKVTIQLEAESVNTLVFQ